MKYLFMGVIRLYRLILTPILPPACRFDPTCSEYAEQALELHGVIWGSIMSVWRILRCNPFSRGGDDPVPETIKEWRLRWFDFSHKSTKANTKKCG